MRRRVIVRAICELGRGLSRKRNFFARTDFFITSFGAARRDEGTPESGRPGAASSERWNEQKNDEEQKNRRNTLSCTGLVS